MCPSRGPPWFPLVPPWKSAGGLFCCTRVQAKKYNRSFGLMGPLVPRTVSSLENLPCFGSSVRMAMSTHIEQTHPNGIQMADVAFVLKLREPHKHPRTSMTWMLPRSEEGRLRCVAERNGIVSSAMHKSFCIGVTNLVQRETCWLSRIQPNPPSPNPASLHTNPSVVFAVAAAASFRSPQDAVRR